MGCRLSSQRTTMDEWSCLAGLVPALHGGTEVSMSAWPVGVVIWALFRLNSAGILIPVSVVQWRSFEALRTG